MYELSIETGFQLPIGDIDAVMVEFESYDQVIKCAEIFVDQGYEVKIRLLNT